MHPERHEVRSPDGTTIPVWISGRGRPLLIVHGSATDHGSWEAVREFLEPHAAVASMDRRATFGDPLSQLSLTTEFEDVAAVVASLGHGVALFGHSSGALCALGASLLTPGISHLMLYEPPLERGPQYPAALRKMEKFLAVGDVDGVYDTWLKDYVGMPVQVAEHVKSTPIGAENRSFAQFLPRDMAAHLAWKFDPSTFARITVPTVYLLGSDTPKNNAQLRGFISLLEGVMPNFSVHEIPGQGHFANFLAPQLMATTILRSIEISGQ